MTTTVTVTVPVFGGTVPVTEMCDYNLYEYLQAVSGNGSGNWVVGTGNELLPVEYYYLNGNQTISSDTDWGSATADEYATAVAVNGNLTISDGFTLSTSVRKLGLIIYVTGDLVVNGTLSMSARGANHGPTGSNISEFDIQIISGAYTADNIWAGTGGAGGVQGPGSDSYRTGVAGSAGSGGACGGGGSGGDWGSGSTTGADGTGFSGGGGGGGDVSCTNAATADGGRGGDACAGSGLTIGCGGGAGNPGGSGATRGAGSANPGVDGTGGAIVVIVEGDITVGATGIIRANGSAGGSGSSTGGGGSGGGSVNLYYFGAYTNDGTVQASGGAAGAGGSANGGAGGAGTVRTVEL